MKTAGISLTVCALAALASAAHAQRLTGINWYTTDSGKHFTGGYGNTYGGDTASRNLYVSVNQAIGGGPLLNSGNLTTAPTRIDVDLSAPGTYNFQVYCNDESTVQNPFWGLNLFFDGNDLQPGISVWNVVDTPGFQAVNPVGTPTLDPPTMGLVQSGNGNVQPVYVGASSQLTLTNYRTWSVHHYNVDRVDNFDSMGGNGNGTLDDVVEFTIQSQPVPEPTSLLAFVPGVATLIRLRRKRR